MNSAATGSARHGSNTLSQSADHDAILNVIRLAHAQSQKLAEQWVPLTKEELGGDDGGSSSKDGRANLTDAFPFRPEQAGLGADVSQAATLDWRGVSIGSTGGPELEKLRRQILGRKARPNAGAKRSENHRAREDMHSGRQAVQQDNIRGTDNDGDDDEEGGRAAAFTSKRAKLPSSKPRADQGSPVQLSKGSGALGEGIRPTGEEDASSESEPTNSSLGSKRRQTSILDQVLADKLKKKKRKKKRKQNQSEQHPGQA